MASASKCQISADGIFYIFFNFFLRFPLSMTTQQCGNPRVITVLAFVDDYRKFHTNGWTIMSLARDIYLIIALL